VLYLQIYITIGLCFAIVYNIADLRGALTLDYRNKKQNFETPDAYIIMGSVIGCLFFWPISLIATIARRL
jgi:hypothetical protein